MEEKGDVSSTVHNSTAKRQTVHLLWNYSRQRCNDVVDNNTSK